MPADPSPGNVAKALVRKRKLHFDQAVVSTLARALITKTGSVIFDVQGIADGDSAALSTVQQFLGIGAKIAGVTVTGTPTAGQVITATNGTSATWSDPSGGGLTADTGWIANSGTGDKTQDLGNWVTTDFSGSDTVSLMTLSGLANYVAALGAKFIAVETALAASLRPNA